MEVVLLIMDQLAGSCNPKWSLTRIAPLECRVLGSFYRDASGTTMFGADVDNFYSPNNYSVYKPSGRVLEYLVNFREGEGIPGGEGDVRIGEVRYSSSRHHPAGASVPVYVSAIDFLGKRTALYCALRNDQNWKVEHPQDDCASDRGSSTARCPPEWGAHRPGRSSHL